MTFEQQAATLSRSEVAAFLAAHADLEASHAALLANFAELQQQLDWFKRQLFGPKSERRVVSPEVRQLWLDEMEPGDAEPVSEITVPEHRRRVSRPEPAADEGAIRFDDSVPVETVVIPNVEIPPAELDDYVEVSQKVTQRLAQRPGAYVVLRIVRTTMKRKSDGRFSCPPAPVSVLERSTADVSFLAGLLIDKVLYHLPLYRQHQRLAACGVHLARSTLTNYFHRSAELLAPIHEAQLASILEGDVVAMDETPIKAGRKKGKPRGKMRTGYYWPVHGDRDEVAFPFSPTRSHTVVPDLLKGFAGTLVSDGYAAYDRYAASMAGVVHAQCWVHVRRKFVEAEAMEPKRAGEALDLIGTLYDLETNTHALGDPEKILAHRREYSRPVVDAFFASLARAQEEEILLPTNPYTKAVSYAKEREAALRVFLDHPGVPLDTNHVERALRPVAVGRKNWMFCTTEVGAHYLGYVQGLLSTCRLQGVDPYTYLVDVLQRVQYHPASRVCELVPRLWKDHFADELYQSMLERASR